MVESSTPAPQGPTAVVLAGGKSTRLGRDKALETLDGVPLLLRVVTALEQLTSDIVIVEGHGRARLALPADRRVRRIQDAWEGLGPLGGLHAGLHASRSPYAWVVGCDLPFLYPPLLAELMRIAEGNDAAVPVWRGQPQTLCAVYSTSCLRAVEETLAGPRRSMFALLTRVRVRYFSEDEGVKRGVPSTAFLSVNTESDLQRARQVLSPGQAG